jgi:predicted transcriptional regulator
MLKPLFKSCILGLPCHVVKAITRLENRHVFKKDNKIFLIATSFVDECGCFVGVLGAVHFLKSSIGSLYVKFSRDLY